MAGSIDVGAADLGREAQGAGFDGPALSTPTRTGLMSAADKAKLDAIEAGATGDMTPTEVLTAIKTIDGVNSGLDADLLDGKDGSSYFTTDTNQTIANAARKIIISDGSVAQAGSSNFQIQSVSNGGNAIMTFHSPTAFACNFGMASDGNFYKGGWSLGANAYKVWDQQNVPLGSISDISGSNGAYKLFRGSDLEARMVAWRNDAIANANANTETRAQAWAAEYTQGRTFGEVGSYVLGFVLTTALGEGTLVAGSSIQPAGFTEGGSVQSDPGNDTEFGGGAAIMVKGGAALGGTWRLMGRMANYPSNNKRRIGLFLRIA